MEHSDEVVEFLQWLDAEMMEVARLSKEEAADKVMSMAQEYCWSDYVTEVAISLCAYYMFFEASYLLIEKQFITNAITKGNQCSSKPIKQ